MPEHFRKNEPGKKHWVTIQDRVGAHRLSALPTTPKQCKYWFYLIISQNRPLE
jgi:hypothetical protein